MGEMLYVLRREFPREVLYDRGAIRLEVVELPRNTRTNGRVWELRAIKMVRGTPHLTLAMATNYRWRVDERLYRDGFILTAGSPEALIMDRLVRDGYAACRPATRRDGKP